MADTDDIDALLRELTETTRYEPEELGIVAHERIIPEPIRYQDDRYANGHWDYPARCDDVDHAMAVIRQNIEEWDEKDAHGWWHTRPVVMALYNEIVRLRGKAEDLEGEVGHGRQIRSNGAWCWCERTKDGEFEARYVQNPDRDEWDYVTPALWCDDPEWVNRNGGKDPRKPR